MSNPKEIEKAKKMLKELWKFYEKNPCGSLRYYVEADLKEVESNPDSKRTAEILEELKGDSYLE